jgi:pimeloyl-ACP methyl ester carboxylesterase
VIRQKTKGIVVAFTFIVSLTVFSSGLFLANAQPSNSTHTPIILIHGYGMTSNVWNWWVDWLNEDNFFNVYPINFTDDRCGSSEEHASELESVVNDILDDTGSEEVNIVAHSKGGLDARWYISNSNMDKIANLIMIGTPNAGSPAAWFDISGCPFGSDFDLFPESDATNVVDDPNSTNYYTIAGNWMPTGKCWFMGWLVRDGGSCLIPGPDDGWVPLDSVNASPNYVPLSQPFPYNHLDLLFQRDVYELALSILDG